jgi:hypothetical protein
VKNRTPYVETTPSVRPSVSACSIVSATKLSVGISIYSLQEILQNFCLSRVSLWQSVNRSVTAVCCLRACINLYTSLAYFLLILVKFGVEGLHVNAAEHLWVLVKSSHRRSHFSHGRHVCTVLVTSVCCVTQTCSVMPHLTVELIILITSSIRMLESSG